MKKGFLLSILLASAFAVIAQNEVMLHLAPRLGTAVFSLNQTIDHPGGTYQMKYTRFEFYISEIKITHDGGQVTPCTDLTLLVRPALDSMYSLGQLPGISNVEAITFSVGVPQALNHADPSLQPAGSPLAPQNPEMHWGWSAGYRFAAIEGYAGTNLSQNFQIHSLGDANYKTQTIATDAEQVSPNMKMIHLIADYSQAVKSINISGGLVVHGTTGAAVTLLNNFKNVVFKADASSAVVDPTFGGAFSVAPNPVRNAAPQVSFSLPTGNDYALTVTDLTGKVIARRTLATGENQSILLDKMPTAGLYFVHLWQNSLPVVVEKLVVLN
ncbi:MAG: T9SS type A sorting domain-containing protein [Saprospiraceae bacterium]|nr:T9SS type A sorting domain-containing protein [Saprospiraceae bacterium]